VIDGALPALDVVPGLAPAPATAAGDPAAAAELFATLVAQLLGQPAPAVDAPVDARVAAPAPAAVAAPPDSGSAVPAPVAASPAAEPALGTGPVAPELVVPEPTRRAPIVEPQDALARAASVDAEPIDPLAVPARQPVERAPTVADQRLAREEPVGARRSEAPATPLLVVVPDPAPTSVVDAPETAPRAAPVELPVEAQVAAKVRQLRLDEDGRHEVTLDLHPAELGSVGVDVVVDGGTVHVALRAEQAPAAELLRSSLDELRQLLTDAGLDVGDLSSHDGARREHHDGRPEHRTDRPQPVVETFVRRTTPVDGVDVLL
jgi:hypothetical protein